MIIIEDILGVQVRGTKTRILAVERDVRGDEWIVAHDLPYPKEHTAMLRQKLSRALCEPNDGQFRWYHCDKYGRNPSLVTRDDISEASSKLTNWPWRRWKQIDETSLKHFNENYQITPDEPMEAIHPD